MTFPSFQPNFFPRLCDTEIAQIVKDQKLAARVEQDRHLPQKVGGNSPQEKMSFPTEEEETKKTLKLLLSSSRFLGIKLKRSSAFLDSFSHKIGLLTNEKYISLAH